MLNLLFHSFNFVVNVIRKKKNEKNDSSLVQQQ